MAGGCLLEVVYGGSRQEQTYRKKAVGMDFAGDRVTIHFASGGSTEIGVDQLGHVRPTTGNAVGGLGGVF